MDSMVATCPFQLILRAIDAKRELILERKSCNKGLALDVVRWLQDNHATVIDRINKNPVSMTTISFMTAIATEKYRQLNYDEMQELEQHVKDMVGFVVKVGLMNKTVTIYIPILG